MARGQSTTARHSGRDAHPLHAANCSWPLAEAASLGPAFDFARAWPPLFSVGTGSPPTQTSAKKILTGGTTACHTRTALSTFRAICTSAFSGARQPCRTDEYPSPLTRGPQTQSEATPTSPNLHRTLYIGSGTEASAAYKPTATSKTWFFCSGDASFPQMEPEVTSGAQCVCVP